MLKDDIARAPVPADKDVAADAIRAEIPGGKLSANRPYRMKYEEEQKPARPYPAPSPKTFAPCPVLPTDPKERKGIPVVTGVLDYFPRAIREIAKVSMAGNLQHNGPDAPLHWARGKSMDFADTMGRHIMERGGLDIDGQRHSAKLAWRALASLEVELEQEENAPISRGSTP